LGPHQLTDLHEKFRVAAGSSPQDAVPIPGVWQPDASDPDLDDIEIDGIPLAVAAAGR
jgi:hypothetical protein